MFGLYGITQENGRKICKTARIFCSQVLNLSVFTNSVFHFGVSLQVIF